MDKKTWWGEQPGLVCLAVARVRVGADVLSAAPEAGPGRLAEAAAREVLPRGPWKAAGAPWLEVVLLGC